MHQNCRAFTGTIDLSGAPPGPASSPFTTGTGDEFGSKKEHQKSAKWRKKRKIN